LAYYISDYQDGTVSIAAGSKDLVGDGTAWASIGLQIPQMMGIQAGDMFMVGGFVALIETVVDDTHITLRDNWGGPTLPPGTTYSIKFSPDQTRVQASTVALIDRLSNGSIDALAQLTLEADTLPYGDAPASMALTPFTSTGRAIVGAADAGAAQTAIGGGATGKAVFAAANAGAAQDAIGATAVGKAVLTSADAAAARTSIGALATIGGDVTGQVVITTTGTTPIATSPAGSGNVRVVNTGPGGVSAGAAYISFNRSSAFGAFFGLDTDGQLKYGGWSLGNNAYRIWHEGNDGAGSGLDADLLDGLQGSAYYSRSNIIGTVSQSGGVPTGAVIERGSNAGGQYVRFADGTQICWLTSLGFSGSGAGKRATTWGYPAFFSVAPVVMCTPAGFAAAFTVLGPEGQSEIGLSTANITVNVTQVGAGTVVGNILAIGRWF
jgi:hypothetical protein